MREYNQKELIIYMLSDYFLDKFFMHEKVQELSVGEQSVIIQIFDDITTQIGEEKSYATIHELLSESAEG